MTTLAYFRSLNVCTTAELLNLKRENPADYDTIMKWTKEQAHANGVILTEKDS